MKLVQIRNVPDEMHRKLKARAALRGMSLSDYALNELRRSLEIPTREEMIERIRRLGPVRLSERPEDIIRAERDARSG